MHGSMETFYDMQSPKVSDKGECRKLSQDPSKFAINAGEGDCVTEDGDGMRFTACSTEIHSEMPTLETIPTSSGMGFLDDPLLDERPERESPTPLFDNGGSARQAALRWRGMTSQRDQANPVQQRDSPNPASKFNVRKSHMPNKRQEKDFEETATATKEDEVEFGGRTVEFIFKPWKQGDADLGVFDEYDEPHFSSDDSPWLDSREVATSAGQELDLTLFNGGSKIDGEACFEAPEGKKVVSNDDDLRASPSKQSSTVESCDRSDTMHSMPDMSFILDSSVMIGPPGRALRKKRIAASLV